MERKIFIEKIIECPVCRNSFPLIYPNPKLYAAAGRDPDRRVTSYSWAQGIHTSVIPHYYAVAQCPQCLFADLKENLENPSQNTKDRLLYEVRKNLDVKRVLLLRKLRRLVLPDEELNWESTVSLHLAAIYNTLLPEKKEQIDHLKLGRLYLRLSWLFLEHSPKKTEPTATPENESPTVKALFDAAEKLTTDFHSLMDDLRSIQSIISIRSQEIGIPENNENNPYLPIITSIKDKSNDLSTLLDFLFQSVSSDRKGTLMVGSAWGDQTLGKVQQLLSSIVSIWPDIPRSEETCIRHAVNAFDYSLKYEDTEQSIEQSLAMVNLIVKLLLKIGDLDAALSYISQIFKSGFRDKQELQNRLNQGKREGNMNEYDQRNILRKIATINNTLQQAADTRKEIQLLIFNKHIDKIQTIATAQADKTPPQIEQAFIDAGFSQDMIPFLKDKGIIKEDDSKKGWFAKKK